VIVGGGEGPRAHEIDIQDAAQVVDFVLQDSGVPSVRFNNDGLGLLIQAFDSNAFGAGHDRGESCHAETSFEKFRGLLSFHSQFRINQDVKRNGAALTLGRLLGRELLDVLGPILDDYELQRQADLRRRQSHSRRVAHGLAHRLDQVLDGTGDNFLRRKRTSRLAQDRFSSLPDFERHLDSLQVAWYRETLSWLCAAAAAGGIAIWVRFISIRVSQPAPVGAFAGQ
jgi:hypothetical protein